MKAALGRERYKREGKIAITLPGQAREGFVFSMSVNALHALIATAKLSAWPDEWLGCPIVLDRAVGWCVEWRAL